MFKAKNEIGLKFIDFLHFMNMLSICLVGDLTDRTDLSYLICFIYSMMLGVERLLSTKEAL